MGTGPLLEPLSNIVKTDILIHIDERHPLAFVLGEFLEHVTSELHFIRPHAITVAKIVVACKCSHEVAFCIIPKNMD
jgi:hypothetical protein